MAKSESDEALQALSERAAYHKGWEDAMASLETSTASTPDFSTPQQEPTVNDGQTDSSAQQEPEVSLVDEMEMRQGAQAILDPTSHAPRPSLNDLAAWVLLLIDYRGGDEAQQEPKACPKCGSPVRAEPITTGGRPQVALCTDEACGWDGWISDDSREMPEEAPRWRDAAIQAKDDLRAIEEAFREATPVGEDGPDPPIGPGHVFAAWSSPAVTMRWIEEMEAGESEAEAQQEPEGETVGDIGDTLITNARALVRRATNAEARVRGLNRLADQLNDGLDARIEQIRELREAARVQPRRVSQRSVISAIEKMQEVLDGAEVDDHELAFGVLDILGIKITPDKEQ